MQFAVTFWRPTFREPAAAGIQHVEIFQVVAGEFLRHLFLVFRANGQRKSRGDGCGAARRACDCDPLCGRRADSDDRCRKAKRGLRARSCFENRCGAALLRRRRAVLICTAPENRSRTCIGPRATCGLEMRPPALFLSKAITSVRSGLPSSNRCQRGSITQSMRASGNASRKAEAAGRRGSRRRES